MYLKPSLDKLNQFYWVTRVENLSEIVYSYVRAFVCNISINSHLIIRHVNITSYHPTKQPINKRTYVVRTLISLIMFKLISHGYADTWEQTHAITLNTTTTTVGAWKIFIRHSHKITHFGKFLTEKNVTLTWYRLPNVTVYSFHTLSPILFF